MPRDIALDTRDGGQVLNPRRVAVLTAEPNTWLFIYSGIAIQGLDAEGHGRASILGITVAEYQIVDEARVRIRLDNFAGTLVQHAAIASMADIYQQDEKGHWIIRSTDVSLEPNGDLVLTVDTAVMGLDVAQFWSFSYHVDVKVILDTATISGTIRWARALADPAAKPLFAITAYSTRYVPASGTTFGSTIEEVEAVGVEADVQRTKTGYEVPYTISGPLVGRTVEVGVDPDESHFTRPGGPVPTLVANQVSGPRPITLSITNLHVTGVDFELADFNVR